MHNWSSYSFAVFKVGNVAIWGVGMITSYVCDVCVCECKEQGYLRGNRPNIQKNLVT